MKKVIFGLLATVAFAQSAAAAEDGKWMVRVRALGVLPQEKVTTSLGINGKINDSVTPEIDATYFFTPNIAAELIAATTGHNVKLTNGTDVGRAWLLPPTLTLQYHFTNWSGIKPYLGAGINYTTFLHTDAGALSTVKYSDSVGPALQAGIDVPIKGNWYANLDFKKIWISTKVKFNGGAVTAKADIDPIIIGAGIGYRF